MKCFVGKLDLAKGFEHLFRPVSTLNNIKTKSLSSCQMAGASAHLKTVFALAQDDGVEHGPELRG